jgi:hypothetical protein
MWAACMSRQRGAGRRRTGKGGAEVFGGDIVAAIPLHFEPLSFVQEAGRQPLHQVCDQGVRFLEGVAWLINRACLDPPT